MDDLIGRYQGIEFLESTLRIENNSRKRTDTELRSAWDKFLGTRSTNEEREFWSNRETFWFDNNRQTPPTEWYLLAIGRNGRPVELACGTERKIKKLYDKMSGIE